MVPEGWKVKRLGDCLCGKPEYGANAPSVGYDERLPRYVRITDIDDKSSLIEDGKVSVVLEGNERYLLKDKDFLLARSGATVGKSYLYYKTDGWAVYAGYLIRFRVDESVLLSEYLKHYTQSSQYWSWVKNTLRAGAQPNINAQEYSSLLLLVPPLSEQLKIVKILDVWDKTIVLTGQLIAAKQQRKKALMQQLLTGQRRFREFEREEWQGVRFSDVLDIEIGRTPSRKRPEYWDADKKTKNVWLSIRDLSGKFVSDSGEYISDAGVKSSRSRLVPAETVVMSFKLTIGRTAILSRSAFTNEAICSLIPKNPTELLNRYLYHALSIVSFHHEMDQAVKGKTLNKAKLNRLKLLLPSFGEQVRIADCLDKMDDELQLYEKKLAALQRQKKGLMQQLLTGRVRVKL